MVSEQVATLVPGRSGGQGPPGSGAGTIHVSPEVLRAPSHSVPSGHPSGGTGSPDRRTALTPGTTGAVPSDELRHAQVVQDEVELGHLGG